MGADGVRGDGKGAMVEHVLDRYGEGRLRSPAGSMQRAQFAQWCWFAEATFARPLGKIVNHKRAFPRQASTAIMGEMAQRSRLCAEAVAQHLSTREFLLGEQFTAADIMMGYTLRMYVRLLDEPTPEALSSYWQRLSARPAYQSTERADRASALK